MKIIETVVAAVSAMLAVGAAEALEMQGTVTVKAAPEVVWQRIGDFCAIKDWLPGVVGCEKEIVGRFTFRTLVLEGGGRIKDMLINETARSYTYEILESQLPVKRYRSTLSVTATGDGTMVMWTGKFDADTVSDAAAEAVVSAIFTEGLEKIAAMYP